MHFTNSSTWKQNLLRDPRVERKGFGVQQFFVVLSIDNREMYD
jgi:hypothetical protein